MDMRARLRRLTLFWHSIRHTRLRQLLARLWLKAKRYCLSGSIGRNIFDKRRSMSQRAVLLVQVDRPVPVLPPRKHLVVKSGQGTELVMLSETYPISIPMKWRPEQFQTGTRLLLLNLHYMEYLEAVSDDMFITLVKDWIAGNPPYQSDYWLDNWNSYALSIRVVVWLQQLSIRWARILPQDRDSIHISVVDQLRFLMHNLELDIGGNHLIKNIKALLWAGAYFDSEESRTWVKRGEDLLLRELTDQVLSDGMHFELSPSYHVQVFSDLLECHVAMGPGKTRSELGSVLKKMSQLVADMTHPDGMISLFGDGGLHMTYLPHECLDAYKLVFNETVEASELYTYADAGYFGVRKTDSLVIADYGPIAPDFLPAHGHGDMFSFEWSIAGLRIITDPGVYEYNPGGLRDYSRSTRAHNTVSLDNASQGEFWSSFRLGRRARLLSPSVHSDTDMMMLEGIHDGYRGMTGGPLHKRRMTIDPQSVEIEDSIVGGSGQAVVSSFLLHPECTVEMLGQFAAKISRAHVTVMMESSAPISCLVALWCPDFGVKIETNRLDVVYGVAPCTGRVFMAQRK